MDAWDDDSQGKVGAIEDRVHPPFGRGGGTFELPPAPPVFFCNPLNPSIGDLAEHPFLGRSCSVPWCSIGLHSMIKRKGKSLKKVSAGGNDRKAAETGHELDIPFSTFARHMGCLAQAAAELDLGAELGRILQRANKIQDDLGEKRAQRVRARQKKK